ncbi:DUF6942 family protein [Pokkaliibacter plantistimulans]|uniref:DUF6942 family protein n=1 Tax=Pokkaliibacter plantistimulans TaxID=1635171 RepID=UPI0011B003B7|nr:hypothetical protein [Pokkaliibacter plantistimulans]
MLNTSLHLGSQAPHITLYIPHCPLLPPDVDPQYPNVPALINANSNHWRKILTIYAKLASPSADWRSYRDQQLLQHEALLCQSTSLAQHEGWHWVAGRANWEGLGMTHSQCQEIVTGQVWRKGSLLLTPYPDYRQFPNRLIDQLRPLLHT